MDKVVLFIEDYFPHFDTFSKMMNGFFVYPELQKIKDQAGLYKFLHNHTNDYNTLKENLFNYIIEQELYNKISLIVLDINLLHKDKDGNPDKSGKQLLADFRKDFYSFFKSKKGNNNTYEDWSNSIPVIALTKFDEDECKEFKQQYGNPIDALNKDDVLGDNNILISAMNNILSQIENSTKYLNKKNQLSGVTNSIIALSGSIINNAKIDKQ